MWARMPPASRRSTGACGAPPLAPPLALPAPMPLAVFFGTVHVASAAPAPRCWRDGRVAGLEYPPARPCSIRASKAAAGSPQLRVLCSNNCCRQNRKCSRSCRPPATHRHPILLAFLRQLAGGLREQRGGGRPAAGAAGHAGPAGSAQGVGWVGGRGWAADRAGCFAGASVSGRNEGRAAVGGYVASCLCLHCVWQVSYM